MREQIFFDDFQTGDNGNGILLQTDNVTNAEVKTATTQTAATATGTAPLNPNIARYTSPGARAKQELIIKANTPETPPAFEISGTWLLIGAAVVGLVLLASADD
jgi:hypothetical protein